jgi:hypothetical protein
MRKYYLFPSAVNILQLRFSVNNRKAGKRKTIEDLKENLVTFTLLR